MSRVRPASMWARTRGLELVGAAIGEAVQPDVADGAVGEVAADDLLLLDDVAGDLERGTARAPSRCTVSVTSLPFGPRIRSRASSTVSPSSGTPSVASTRSPAARPAFSAGEPSSGGDDDEPAGRAERGAALRAVGGLGRDLGADPLELAADALQALAVLLRGQVRRIRVLEGLDHPADRALDERRRGRPRRRRTAR